MVLWSTFFFAVRDNDCRDKLVKVLRVTSCECSALHRAPILPPPRPREHLQQESGGKIKIQRLHGMLCDAVL